MIDSASKPKILPRWKRVALDFLKTTNLHGLPHVLDVPYIGLRLFWTVLFLACLGGFCYHSSVVVRKYFRYPTQTQISFIRTNASEFPAITLCNQNPIEGSRIPEGPWRDITDLDIKISCDTLKYMRDMMNSTTSEIVKSRLKDAKDRCGDLPDVDITTAKPMSISNYLSSVGDNFVDYDELVLYAENSDLTDVTSLLVPDFIKMFGKINYSAFEQFDSFVRECSFDRKECHTNSIYDPLYTKNGGDKDGDFRVLVNQRYGRCFTFSSYDGALKGFADSWPNKTTTNQGTMFGLRVTLNVNVSEYIGVFAPHYGVRVTIHDPGTTPYPESEGFDIPVGYLTSVGIRRQLVNRLKHPYESNCSDSIPWENTEHFGEATLDNNIFGNTFSYLSCRSDCFDSKTYQQCTCTTRMGYYLDSYWDNLPRLCDMFNTQDRDCQANVTARIMASDECDCPNSCREVIYQRNTAATQWPTWEYTHLIMNNFPQNLLWNDFNRDKAWLDTGISSCRTEPDSFEYDDSNDSESTSDPEPDYNCHSVTRNLVRLHVYYESLQVYTIDESVGYPLESLAADFGGIFGLWLGVSVAAIFEIFQFLGMLVGFRSHHRLPSEE